VAQVTPNYVGRSVAVASFEDAERRDKNVSRHAYHLSALGTFLRIRMQFLSSDNVIGSSKYSFLKTKEAK
jgi:hypothetical protein